MHEMRVLLMIYSVEDLLVYEFSNLLRKISYVRKTHTVEKVIESISSPEIQITIYEVSHSL